MPPPFSAEDRARITEQLLEAGRSLFTTQGLRKTSLDELVAPAGIAKPASMPSSTARRRCTWS
jgi:AcrR family transcriptional regulator